MAVPAIMPGAPEVDEDDPSEPVIFDAAHAAVAEAAAAADVASAAAAPALPGASPPPLLSASLPAVASMLPCASAASSAILSSASAWSSSASSASTATSVSGCYPAPAPCDPTSLAAPARALRPPAPSAHPSLLDAPRDAAAPPPRTSTADSSARASLCGEPCAASTAPASAASASAPASVDSSAPASIDSSARPSLSGDPCPMDVYAQANAELLRPLAPPPLPCPSPTPPPASAPPPRALAPPPPSAAPLLPSLASCASACPSSARRSLRDQNSVTIKATTVVKDAAGAIDKILARGVTALVTALRAGAPPYGTPYDSLNQAVKAIAVARQYAKETGAEGAEVTFLPFHRFDSCERSDPQRFAFLVFPVPRLAVALRTADETVLNVARGSDVHKMAGAIIAVMLDRGQAVMKAAGADAIFVAMSAVVCARHRLVARHGFDLMLAAAWITEDTQATMGRESKFLRFNIIKTEPAGPKSEVAPSLSPYMC